MASVFGAENRIVGSDLLGSSLVVGLENYGKRTDQQIITAFAGSYPGWQQLQAGRAAIGILTFPPGQNLPTEPFVCLPFAYHIAVVLVPDVLPLRQLSYAQLAGIFGTTGGTNVARWGDLDLAGDWTARPISPHALTAGANLAAAIFRHAVLHDGHFKPIVTRHETIDGLLGGLAQAKGGWVALVSQAPLSGLQ